MPCQDDPPLHNYCVDFWEWNKRDKSHEVRIIGDKCQTAFFHPNWSNGTAGVRGTRILNRGRFYWEINVTQRIFGTSMMFGKFPVNNEAKMKSGGKIISVTIFKNNRSSNTL